MTHDKASYVPRDDYALIIQQEGKPQQILTKYLRLLLNYHYGFTITMAGDPSEGARLLLQYSREVRCVFLIHSQPLAQTTVNILNKHGELPLLLLVPERIREQQATEFAELDKVSICSWEQAVGHGEMALGPVMSRALGAHGIGDLSQDIEQLPYTKVQQRIELRLRSIKTLPTLPEIVLRIMRLVNDPRTTTEQLEQVLCTDPAMVMKLLQVVKSPVFASTVQRGSWSLAEIIVRLGLKKVGAIAQQIKMINSLMAPEESDFDLRRFWEHSVGSGIIADKLHARNLLRLPSPIAFSTYWIGALLHDMGKLALGFFYWDGFARITSLMEQHSSSFRSAEAQLSESINHEYIGRLLLMHSQMDEELATSVGTHHTPGKTPGDLVCLIHMADNLCKDLGLGYSEAEKGEYSQAVLSRLGMEKEEIDGLREALGTETVEEIRETVQQCM